MEALTTLIDGYSVGDIAFIIILLIIAVHFIGTSWEWIWDKIKTWFNLSDRKERQHQAIMSSIDQVKESVSNNSALINDLDARINEFEMKHDLDIDRLEEKMDDIAEEHKKNFGMLKEQIQQNTREHIIERHHHFCYDLGYIDDNSLQNLEVSYMYYRQRGGNSYIEKLMNELEALPRINADNVKGVDIT